MKMAILFAIVVTGVCAQAPTLYSELETGPVVANDSRALYNAYDFVFCKVLKLACFRAGTPIETENGPQAIETIQPGDLVWCEKIGRFATVVPNFTKIPLQMRV